MIKYLGCYAPDDDKCPRKDFSDNFFVMQSAYNLVLTKAVGNMLVFHFTLVVRVFVYILLNHSHSRDSLTSLVYKHDSFLHLCFANIMALLFGNKFFKLGPIINLVRITRINCLQFWAMRLRHFLFNLYFFTLKE